MYPPEGHEHRPAEAPVVSHVPPFRQTGQAAHACGFPGTTYIPDGQSSHVAPVNGSLHSHEDVFAIHAPFSEQLVESGRHVAPTEFDEH